MKSQMRAAYPVSAGGPEVLTVGERLIPQPGAGQVLIKVAFAGVNRHDCNQRQRGEPPAGATDILGLEVSGEIAARGEDAAKFAVGEQVCALVNGGGYADYVLADEYLTLPIPEHLELRESAALPEALFTAWHNVVDLCGLHRGDSLLVHGGVSGVGVITIQLGRLLGADVFATAGSDERCAMAEKIGAKRCFNYRTQDFVAGVMEATQGHGADVILDMAGGLYAEKNLNALAHGGRITHLSSSGRAYSPPLKLIMQKEARITGSLLRPLESARKRAIADSLIECVWPALGRDIIPVIDMVLPLEQAADAHRRMEAGMSVGKILLKP